MATTAEIRKLSGKLAKCTEGNATLQQFLDRSKGLHPVIDEALEGIYCSRSGKISVPCFDDNHLLEMGWHTNLSDASKARVEFVYIS